MTIMRCAVSQLGWLNLPHLPIIIPPSVIGPNLCNAGRLAYFVTDHFRPCHSMPLIEL